MAKNLGFTMTSMNDSLSSPASAANPQLAHNKRLVTEFLELAFANRVDETLLRLAPDVRWWVIGRSPALKVSGEKDGPQIERLLRSVARAVPGGMKLTVHSLTAEDDRVSAEVEAEGTWVNGRDYRNRYHFMIRLRDGLIISVHEYMDTLHLFEVMQN